jgi:hypothetical protein
MLWIIGEEFALGAESVLRTEGRGTLLTNPGRMILWMIPFLFLGFTQITASISLIWLWYQRRVRQIAGPGFPDRERLMA